MEQVARRHSEDMIGRNYFSHETKGRDEGFAARIRRFGHDDRAVGENIALGGNPIRIIRA